MKPEVQAAWVQAIGSVVAILAAVGIAWWQSRAARDAQQAMCRPHLTFEFRVRESPPRFRIDLKNVGLGPAIIETCEIFIGGQPLPDGDKLELVERTLAAMGFTRGLGGGQIPVSGAAIRSGDMYKMLRWRDVTSMLTINQLAQILTNVRFVVKYKSTIGESLVAVSDNEPV